jgi:tetratricopeptide (TPR) repeat protein
MAVSCRDAPAPGTAEDYFRQGDQAMEEQDLDKAVSCFTAAIRLNPKAPNAFVARGYAYYLKKDNDKAMADLDEAIRLDPKNAMAYADRGNVHLEMKDYARALADFDEAVRLEHWRSEFINNRGIAYRKSGNPDQAVADHLKAIEINPKDPGSYNCLAWLWATYPQGKIRNGRKAVEYARKACEMTKWNNPFCLDTLAAAYAEVGDFKAAVQWQKKALEYPEFVRMYGEAARARVTQYQNGEAYREKTK